MWGRMELDLLLLWRWENNHLSCNQGASRSRGEVKGEKGGKEGRKGGAAAKDKWRLGVIKEKCAPC